jgi:outer membrane protein assembly factor BamB
MVQADNSYRLYGLYHDPLVPSFLRNRWVLIGLGVAVLLVAGAAVAAYELHFKKPGNVSNPGVEFEAPPPATTATEPSVTTTTPTGKKKPAKIQTVDWPRYGYTVGHTRVFEPDTVLDGPWRKDWVHQVHALTEFGPVIRKGVLYQLIDDGQLVAMKASNGKRVWERRVGALAASSPAIDDRYLYVTVLEDRKGSKRGKVLALEPETGRIRWAKALPSRSESSPLVLGNRLYFGSEDGTLYALDRRSGRQLWTYHANGAIKGSPTYSDGKLYFGNYGGQVQAIRADTGKLVWRTSGGSRGNFYATAAVAFGRVYIGNTDGREYSFSAHSGDLAWAHQTGGYVYASAAVDNVPDLGPTVFVGSYDGTFYAFDAQTGDVRWRYEAKGHISGGATVVGTTVYFANQAKRETVGLGTRGGKVLFRRGTGSYDPITSDGEKLYLTGSSSITALRQVPERFR